jgi:hypothetical protein
MPVAAVAAGALRIGSMFARGAGKGGGLLRKAVLKRTKVKRENIAKNKVFNKKLTEKRRRQEKETLLETFKTRGKSGVSGVQVPGKGILDRVLEFIGVLLIGWLVDKLPQIIAWVEDLITRIKLLISSLTSFINNLGNWFKSIGSVISSTLDNWRNFDFTDKSGKVKKAMTDMENAFKGMQNDVENMKTALSGDTRGVGAAGGGSLNAADIEADTPEEKAFIATVRELEGTGGSGGYNTVYGGAVVPGLTEMTLAELYEASKLGGTDRLPDRLGGRAIPYHKDRYNSSASGALQLMPETLRGLVNSGRFSWSDTFSPATQNKMILALARQGGINIENMNESQMTKAGNIWASLTPRYGQTSRTASQSMSVYRKNLQEAGGGGSGGRYGSGGGNVTEYLTGDRGHPNYEYDGHGRQSNYHDHIAFRTLQDKERAKAALRAAGIQIGSEYRPGDDGWHGVNLAIDIPGAQWGGSGAIGQREFNGSAKVRQVLINAGFGGAGLGHGTSAIARVPGRSMDLGYASGPQNTVIIIEEEAPPMAGGGGKGGSPPIIMGASLNSIIKKHLLTSLAYN